MARHVMQDLGARRCTGGVEFAVWALKAADVEVVLFDGDASTSHRMAFAGGDVWRRVVPDVRDGQPYVFRIDGAEKADPRATALEHSAGRSLLDLAPYPWRCHDFRLPPWNELVLYQLHLASFPDKKPAPEDQLRDAVADLWYLEKLGVNAVQLLPTAEFPGDESCGYNPASVFAVESHYGGPRALKSFVDAAHARGIAVLLDVVINHLSPEGARSLWQFTRWQQPFVVAGEPGDGGGQFFYNDWRAYTPWGKRNRPDYGRQEVRDFLCDGVMSWLREFRVDGFRFDSVVNVRNVYGNDADPANDLGDGWRLLQRVNDAVGAEGRNALTIAEDLQDNAWITRETWAGGAGFGAQWDVRFFHALRETLETPIPAGRSMWRLADALSHRFGGDAFRRVVAVQTHDMAAAMNEKHRLAEVVGAGDTDRSWHAKKRCALGAAMTLTAPGIPMILQGDEILEWRQFGDRRSAHGIDWSRFCDKTITCRACMEQAGLCRTADGHFCGRTVECGECPELPGRCAPTGRFAGFAALHRDLIDLRLRRPETRGLRGQHLNVFHVNDRDKVIAYHRYGDDGGDAVVVLNFGEVAYPAYTIGLPLPGLWKVRFNGDSRWYDPSFGDHPSFDAWATDGSMDGLRYHGTFGLGPCSALVLCR